ncbi:MAG: hypothetical protein IKS17_03810 [Firmicutes bacterium]|nr:hypothetical protein [Bacillota bacterium]
MDIFWDESIHDRKAVEQALKKGKRIHGLYLICITKDGKMEIMSAAEAFKPACAALELKIIGAASGKENAVDALARIYRDYLEEHGTIDGLAMRYRQ